MTATHEPLQPAHPIPRVGEVTIRVRYCECDPMGVVHHASYPPWLEMGRTEMLREAGESYAAMEAAGLFLVIVKVDCSYKRPARYDDLIEIRTTLVQATRVKLRHSYELYRVWKSDAPDDTTPELVMTASTLLACVDGDGRPTPLPEWFSTSG